MKNYVIQMGHFVKVQIHVESPSHSTTPPPGGDAAAIFLCSYMFSFYWSLSLYCSAVKEENPYTRIKEVVKWYLSGFYKKPKVFLSEFSGTSLKVFALSTNYPNIAVFNELEIFLLESGMQNCRNASK